MKTRNLIGSALLAAFALTACGKSPGERMAEAAIEAGTGQKADVSADGDQVTFKTDKGDMKITGGDSAVLPATFPKDVWLPSGYKVASSMEMPGAMVVEVQAPGTVQGLAADAGKAMVAQGWKQRVAMAQSAETHIIVFEKDQRDASLTINADPDSKGVRTSVQVTTKQ
jgi:hypothetical protein